MKIKKVVEMFDLNVGTIRYYECVGAISPVHLFIVIIVAIVTIIRIILICFI